MASTASASRVSVAPSVRTARRGAARRVAAQAANSSYVRKHILDLAPYTPIVPFEILSGACQLRDRAASRAVLAFPIARGARVHPSRVPDPSPLDASLRRATRPRPGRHREVGREREPLRAASWCVSSSLPHRAMVPLAPIRTYQRSRRTPRPRAAGANGRLIARASPTSRACPDEIRADVTADARRRASSSRFSPLTSRRSFRPRALPAARLVSGPPDRTAHPSPQR